MSINKLHARNKDKFLDRGGPNEVAAIDLVDVISKKHTQNTDTILTTDGVTALFNVGILKRNLLADDTINIQIDEIRARDGDGLKLFDDAGNGIFIKDGGNVGIGTSTPNSDLEFPATLTNRRITLFQNVNNDHQFFGFGINGNALRYQVSALTSAHIFFAGIGSSSSQELMRIQGDGKVKIGNVNEVPLTTLHILDDSPTIRLSTGGTGNTGGFEISLGSVVDFKGLGNNDYLFSTNNVEKMRITAGGRVLIGATSGFGNLHIEEDTAGTSAQLILKHADNTNTNSGAFLNLVTVDTTGGNPSIVFSIANVNDWSMGVDNSDGDKFKIGTTSILGAFNLFTIERDGNVGIGTTSPARPLHIQDTGGAEIQFTSDSGGTPRDWHIGPATGDGRFTIVETGVDERVTILEGGNFGIGTISPGTKLEIAGQVKITGGTPGLNKVLTSDASGLATWEIPATSTDTSIYDNNGTVGSGRTVAITDTLNFDSDTLVIDGANNRIGIGTNTPNSTHHVEGSVSKSIVTKTAAYTATSSDYTILVNTTSVDVTITIPTAIGIKGRIYNIKKIDSSIKTVIIDPNLAEKIDGSLTHILTDFNESITIQSDNANWVII